MRFNVNINQSKCLQFQLTASEGAMMDLLNQLSSWADEKVILGKTYYFLSRTKVIDEIPFFFSKPDTVYRAFKKLESKNLLLHKKEGRQDFIRLSATGKAWNKTDLKLGNISEFRANSEINPSKLGNISEKHDTPKNEFLQGVPLENSEINPTYNIYNTTIDKSLIEILQKIKSENGFAYDAILTNQTFHERLQMRMKSEGLNFDFEKEVFPILIKWLCDTWTGEGLNATSGKMAIKCTSYVIAVLKNGGLKKQKYNHPENEVDVLKGRKRIDYAS